MAENQVEDGMLAELDVLVFLKTNENLARVAELVFGALNTPYEPTEPDEAGAISYQATGLAFRAVLYENTGEMADPEFEAYGSCLEVTSQYWDVDLDTLDLEGPLSEYYARLLAFELNLETATEILVETTEDAEIFEIRSYRRNPQYRLDQAPTTPKVFVIETREVESSFEEEWEEDEGVELVDEEGSEEYEEDIEDEEANARAET